MTSRLRRANFSLSVPFGMARVMVSNPVGVFCVTVTPDDDVAVSAPTV